MAACEYLAMDIGINCKQLTDIERCLLEVEIIYQLWSEIEKLYGRESISILKIENDMNPNITKGKGANMSMKNIIQLILNDLIENEEYNITGLATYTQSTPDVIFDVVSGLNQNPSMALSRKIIELHRLARRDVYLGILMKIIKNLSNELKLKLEAQRSK